MQLKSSKVILLASSSLIYHLCVANIYIYISLYVSTSLLFYHPVRHFDLLPHANMLFQLT